MSSACLAVAVLGGAAADPSPLRYVLAHRVNLRVAPSASASVAAQLDIGTAARLVARQATWCEVEIAEAHKPVSHGFVACDLLAETPPDIRQLDKQRLDLTSAQASTAARLPLDERAFWLSPSLERWEALAADQQVVGVRDGMATREPSAPEPRSVPSRSFSEALALLASGTLTIRDPVVPAPARLDDEAAAVLRAAPLPAAHASWFGSGDIDAVLSSGIAETGEFHDDDGRDAPPPVVRWHDPIGALDVLAHRVHARVTARIDGPWQVGHDGTLYGVAGIGATRIGFAPELRFQEVLADGNERSQAVAELRFRWPADVCQADSATVLLPAHMPSEPLMADVLVAWVGTRPAAAKARVVAHPATVTAATAGGGHYRVTVREVDIDGDGHPDFIVHEWVDLETELNLLGRLVHANVAGQWVRTSRDAGAAPCYD